MLGTETSECFASAPKEALSRHRFATACAALPAWLAGLPVLVVCLLSFRVKRQRASMSTMFARTWFIIQMSGWRMLQQHSFSTLQALLCKLNCMDAMQPCHEMSSGVLRQVFVRIFLLTLKLIGNHLWKGSLHREHKTVAYQSCPYCCSTPKQARQDSLLRSRRLRDCQQ